MNSHLRAAPNNAFESGRADKQRALSYCRWRRAAQRERSTSTVGPPLRLGFNTREDRNAQIQRD